MGSVRKRMLWVLALFIALTGCNMVSSPTGSTTEPTRTDAGTGLVCLEISRFSGGFVEDGTDAQVQDVAAILVANNTGKFLDLATVTYQVGDRTATFRITGLPAGRRVWVLESNRMQIREGDELILTECKDSYNPNAIAATDDLSVSRQGNTLTLTNTSDKKLSNVAVYFKNTLEDGTFMGGICYLMAFGDMAPGATVTRQADHFGATSEIVRLSYQ